MKESLFDTQDFYKFTMGDFIDQEHPDAEVTFRMHNRQPDVIRIADYTSVEELQEHYDRLQDLRFTSDEIDWLRSLTDAEGKQRFRNGYLGRLAAFQMPKIRVFMDTENNDISAEATGLWPDVSLTEIPMLSTLSEACYPNYLTSHGISKQEAWDGGDRRFDYFAHAAGSQPGFRFADFCTRRRFGSEWQDHITRRILDEIPETFIGTSNPYLAKKYGIKPIGTNAHELGQVFAGIEENHGGSPIDGFMRMVRKWPERYPDMPVLLTDTYTTGLTLHELSDDELDRYKTFRIDSGKERKIGAQIIAAVQAAGLDPREKSLLFSNSLSIDEALALDREFRIAGRIGATSGIGGGLGNNMEDRFGRSTPRWNVVSKAVSVDGRGLVKLSDDEGKHMGNPADVARYQREVAERLALPRKQAA